MRGRQIEEWGASLGELPMSLIGVVMDVHLKIHKRRGASFGIKSGGIGVSAAESVMVLKEDPGE